MNSFLLISLLAPIQIAANQQLIKLELQKEQVPLGHTLLKYQQPEIYYGSEKQGRNRHLSTYDYTTSLQNSYDFQYYGTLYMGSQRQKMTFIFDTGSSWLWIPSDACPTSQCPGNTFHYAKSSTYSPSQTSQNVQYGKGSVTGYVVADQVALTNSNQFVAQNAQFLSIYSAIDLTGLSTDGLVGLSPNFMTGSGQLFITSLINSGAISRSMFSLKLSISNQTSTVWFGGYDDNTVLSYFNSSYTANKAASDLIAWMNISSKQYWEVNLIQAQVAGKNLQLQMFSAVFDSGASLMYIPTRDYQTIYNAIFTNFSGNCYLNSKSGVTYCDCNGVQDSRYPTISIQLSQYIFYIRNQDYLDWDPQYKKCIFCFQEDNSGATSFWLLGDPFLRAYYMIFDQDNQRVGLVGLYVDNGVSSGGQSTQGSSLNSSSDSGLSSSVIWIIISAGIFFFFVIFTCIIYRVVKRRRQFKVSSVISIQKEISQFQKNFESRYHQQELSTTNIVVSQQTTPSKINLAPPTPMSYPQYGEPASFNSSNSQGFTRTNSSAVSIPKIRTNVSATYVQRHPY